MLPYWQSQFSPYIGDVIIRDISYRFFYGTPLSRDWYDPIKAHTMIEYLWVLEHIEIAEKQVLDVGAHHGHYSCFFAAMGGRVTAVEPLPGNIALLEVNGVLNNFDTKILQLALSDRDGSVTFLPRSNGKLFPGIGITVLTKRLSAIGVNADLIKLDIEGAEFRVFPKAIDEMENTKVWIIEVHNRAGNILDLVEHFKKRDFNVSYVDRHLNEVLPFPAKTPPPYTTTIFCIK
jgi:FkbM family methyltransferase